MLEYLFGEKPSPQIEIGSIGWEDEDEYAYLGTDDNDGHTLVRVQLFRGRDASKPLNPTRAQGHRIVCHIPDGMFRIPKKDTRCYVAIPEGMEQVPGAGIIIACVSKSPPTQFAKDRVVIDFGSDTHVLFKGKSVAMSDHGVPARWLGVGTPRGGGTPGVTLSNSDGSGLVIQDGAAGIWVSASGEAKTLIQMTTTKVECLSKAGGMWKLDGNFYTLGTTCTIAGSGVYLGKAPEVSSMVGYGSVPGAAPTGCSPSVFVSKM